MVKPKVILVAKRNPKTRKSVRVKRHDSVTATPVAPKIKLQARTQKQREATEALDAMPMANCSPSKVLTKQKLQALENAWSFFHLG